MAKSAGTFHGKLISYLQWATIPGTAMDTGQLGANAPYFEADYAGRSIKIDAGLTPFVGNNLLILPYQSVPAGMRFYVQNLVVTNSGAAASVGTTLPGTLNLVYTGDNATTSNVIATFTAGSLGTDTCITLPAQGGKTAVTGVADNCIGLQTALGTTQLGLMVTNVGVGINGTFRIFVEGYMAP